MVGSKQTKFDEKLTSHRRTKVLATIGPATDSYELIHELIESGANGIRLNFSHGTFDERQRQIKWVRKAAEDLGIQVAIVQDLQGPKIRLGDFDGVIDVKKGQTIALELDADFSSSGHIPTQYDLSKKVKRGERIFLFDGRLRTEVTAVKDGVVYAEALNSSSLIKRKGINVPDTDFGGDVITATAVLVGADCLMLSDETANGSYPIEAVKTMHRIIEYTELNSPLSVTFKSDEDHSKQAAISEAIIKLAQTIEAKAIIAETKSGTTAVNISARRISIPVLAVTDLPTTAHQLALVFGVESFVRPADPSAAVHLSDFLRKHRVFKRGDIVVTVSGKYPGVVGTTDTIKVRMLK